VANFVKIVYMKECYENTPVFDIVVTKNGYVPFGLKVYLLQHTIRYDNLTCAYTV